MICLVPMFPSWVMVLKLSKKCSFSTLARNLKPVEAIFIYASKRSRYVLWEHGNYLLYTMAYCFGDIKVGSRKSFLF